MKSYRMAIKKRAIWAWIGTGALLFLAAAAMIYGSSHSGADHMGDYIRGMQAGVLGALTALALSYSLRLTLALRNEAKLEKLRICETDERNLFIQNKICGLGFNLAMALLAIACFLAGYWDSTVFFTLLAALFGMSFIKAGLKVYFFRKY